MKYLTRFFASFITVVLSVAILNWFIDPYGMFWSPTVSNLNEKKVKANSRVRLTKLYRPSSVQPEVLIVGNSRAEMGLNPQHELFGNKVVYNQALPGSSVNLQVSYALNVIEQNPQLEKIIMSLDVADFLANKNKNKPVRSVSAADLYAFDKIKDFLSLLFSIDTLTDSLQTVFLQDYKTNAITSHGFNTAETFLSVIQSEGIIALYRQKYADIAGTLTHEFYIEHNQSKSTQLIALQTLLDKTQERSIEVVFFINPYHYSYLHAFNDAGYWNAYLDWKQMISDFVELRGQNILLWDFSGFNQFTTETVPFQQVNTKMDWYWEPSHYREELGNKILEVMLSGQHEPEKFGYVLNHNTIKEKLAMDSHGLKITENQWQVLKQAIK